MMMMMMMTRLTEVTLNGSQHDAEIVELHAYVDMMSHTGHGRGLYVFNDVALGIIGVHNRRRLSRDRLYR